MVINVCVAGSTVAVTRQCYYRDRKLNLKQKFVPKNENENDKKTEWETLIVAFKRENDFLQTKWKNLN